MNSNVEIKQNQEKMVVSDQPFEGYTLEELRYQRALIALKADFCKERLKTSVGEITQNGPLSRFTRKNKTSSLLKGSGIVGKLAKSLDVLDYAVLGFTMFKTVKSLISKFKK